ncbi:MAG: uracil-DNA glycosylase [Sphingopyxis sp.]|uniref:uracil-DNA glycosylase n=1 Tax=Sphingopyxis sp. TaxID=1908224 RepID=UPI002AB9358B|nr:uracil-DNA glycosylase [Sphingopyxis sp.]MDZ3831110.1 uracil-DNA glycosylase [Sphingopyxis sp.]
MDMASPLRRCEPPRNCRRCPRLVALRRECRAEHPDWWNAPVPVFGDGDGWLALVGLAPGRLGANRTGRPFTGDRSGDVLFDALARFGLSKGRFDGRADDGLVLDGAMIFNAVKCLPPDNRPLPSEIAACRRYFERQLAAMPRLRVIIALGRIAHEAVLRAAGERLAAHPFAHGAVHRISGDRYLVDSYHCSRYNMNTGRLTPDMFAGMFASAMALRDK